MLSFTYEQLEIYGRIARKTDDWVYLMTSVAVKVENNFVYGTPGASLQFAHELDAEARKAGIDGEMRVAKELERLAALYPNTYVFHSVKLPLEMGDIDHVVVRGNQVLLVDSKNWKANAFYEVVYADREEAVITRDGEEFVGGVVHLPAQMERWKRFLGSTGAKVKGTLVIANNESNFHSPTRPSFTFVNLARLERVFHMLFLEQSVVPPMKPQQLAFFKSLLQNPDGSLSSHARVPVHKVPKLFSPESILSKNKWAIGLTLLSLFSIIGVPLALFVAIPVSIFILWQKKQLRLYKLRGVGLMRVLLTLNCIVIGLVSLICVFLLGKGVF